MPLDAERTDPTVTFTTEAELALEREVARFERRLRAKAIEASVRTRGFPAEVTGTDVAKSSRDLSHLKTSVSADEEMVHHWSLQSAADRRYEMVARSLERGEAEDPEKNRYKRTSIYRLFSIYGWLGVAVSLIGAMYPVLHDVIKGVLHNPDLRQAFLISSMGLGLAVVGFAARSLFKRRWMARYGTRFKG